MLHENEIKIRPGDVVVIDHPQVWVGKVTVDTAHNWQYNQSPGAASDWYIEGRSSSGAIYWKQGCDGGHIVSLNGEKVIPGSD